MNGEGPQPDGGIHLLIQIRRVAAGLLVIAGLAAIYLARDFLLPVTFAFFIAITFRPMVRNLARRGIPPWATTATIALVAIICTAAASYVFAGAIAQWAADAPALQRAFLNKISALKDSFSGLISIGETLRKATAPEDGNATPEVIVRQPVLPSLFSFVAAYPLNLVITASGSIVIAVFLMASGDLFYEKLIKVLPSLTDKKAALRIALDIEQEVSAYLLSITIINAGLAAAVGLAFWAIGLPTPHLWALFAFIQNYIPYLGPISGLAVSAAIGLVTFDTLWQALMAPLAYGLLIGLETQIITPAVLSRRMSINAVMILLSLAFWAWAWGIAGIVLAVPILVTFRVLCSHVEALSAFGEFLAQKDAPTE